MSHLIINRVRMVKIGFFVIFFWQGMIFHLLSSLESPYFIKKIMEYYDYNRICDDAVINTITARVVEELEKKMEKLAEQQNSPYIFGIDGLARYIGIGETMAQELKNNNEIPCSQRGRKIWFEKKEVEKFMRKNRV